MRLPVNHTKRRLQNVFAVIHQLVHSLFKNSVLIVEIVYCQMRWDDGCAWWAKIDWRWSSHGPFQGTIRAFIWNRLTANIKTYYDSYDLSKGQTG
jgi:hypothetical protein